MHPFIKWVGGKTQILGQVLEKFPKEINNYIEPFLGGGSVLLELLCRRREGGIIIHGKILASDLNRALICAYQHIQQRPGEVIEELRRIMSSGDGEEFFYEMRERFNGLEDGGIDKTALFIYLNKTCFRGMYRVGPHGFNVPYGNYTAPKVFDEEHILSLSELIRDVEFYCCSFEEAMGRGTEGDFMYLDPPYAPETVKSFVSYTARGFSLESHKILFRLCKELREKNIGALLSNSDVDLLREEFPSDKYRVQKIMCRRAINSKDPSAKAKELLILF